MSSVRLLASACALAVLHTPAFAASDAELAEIRSEIRSLKSSYEARIQALEQRLKYAEARAAVAPAVTVAPAPAVAPAAGAVAPVKTGAQSSASAFNHSISAILNGRYTHTSRDPS